MAVVGGSGSGKSTVARRLAERHELAYVELDALHWGPNWTPCPDDEFRTRVEAATAGEAWVVDGDYTGKAKRRHYEERSARYEIVRLRSPREIEDWLGR